MLLRSLDLIFVVGFFTTIPFFVKIFSGVNYYWDYVGSQFSDETLENYDFIVVGAGSSGAVVANRLSKNNKVLLLEAGGDPLLYNSIPGLASDMLHHPGMDWGYKTVQQKNSNLAMVDKRSAWPRGKMLGGTSNLNYMVYSRGNPKDFDNWAKITGDPTWNYENVLPYFMKSLDYNGKFVKNVKHYGKAPYGKLSVSNYDWATLRDYWMKAGKEMGYDEVDLNGPQKPGFGELEVTERDGFRSGTYPSFIKTSMLRKNLVISRYSQATKIKLDASGRAVGVWYVRHGVKKFARATKEIIVSGGTIGSAQLLMLSGIGPKKHLESVGIKPKVDLPVGQNLKDHLSTLVFPFIIDKPLSFIPARDFGISNFLDLFLYGKGILKNPSALQSWAFVESPIAKKLGTNWPDLQQYLFGFGVGENLPSDLQKFCNLDPMITDKYLKPHYGKDSFAILTDLGLVKSTGEIKLKDKNPFSQPIIDPNYLSHPTDLKILVEGAKFAVEIAETKAFQSLNATYSTVLFPGCEQHQFRSNAYWECYVRHLSFTLYHHCGTCTMGKPNDPKAVVDSRLRVLKTKGLRVSDASIMPDIVNGNTNAPVIMIGEKASDFIREYWSEQHVVSNALDRLLGIHLTTCAYSKLV